VKGRNRFVGGLVGFGAESRVTRVIEQELDCMLHIQSDFRITNGGGKPNGGGKQC
jgi:hypothetical protein